MIFEAILASLHTKQPSTVHVCHCIKSLCVDEKPNPKQLKSGTKGKHYAEDSSSASEDDCEPPKTHKKNSKQLKPGVKRKHYPEDSSSESDNEDDRGPSKKQKDDRGPSKKQKESGTECANQPTLKVLTCIPLLMYVCSNL